MQNHLTLLELTKKLKSVFEASFTDTFWIVAEISSINFNQSGHCYMELVEKDPDNDKILARIKANIWSYALRMIKPYFETTTGQQLSEGLKILINVGVEYHEIYGISLNIINIDPSYTIGDIERRKIEIINKLTEEGVINMNKELEIPSVPQKIAVISSETAAGYGDWLNQLDNNKYGYKFYYKLFPAYMQGKNAEQSIINALEKIYEYEDFFDIVVIIRGGGSQADFNCFNTYLLAYYITQFPLPIITGIGHERDETIVDIVANLKLKTPTAVAEFIINKMESFDSLLKSVHNEVIEKALNIINNLKHDYEKIAFTVNNFVKNIISQENFKLQLIKKELYNQSNIKLTKNKNIISQSINNVSNISKYRIKFLSNECDDILNQIKIKSENYFHKKKFENELIHSKIEALNPQKILKRGYSITTHNGKVLKSSKNIKENYVIETKLYDGKLKSTVNYIEK